MVKQCAEFLSNPKNVLFGVIENAGTTHQTSGRVTETREAMSKLIYRQDLLPNSRTVATAHLSCGNSRLWTFSRAVEG